jgi:predicted RNase H-like HicB family nuclease
MAWEMQQKLAKTANGRPWNVRDRGPANPGWRLTSKFRSWARVGGASSFGELARLVTFCHPLRVKSTAKREFSVIVERDEDGFYVATVPALPGCHTQARSLDRLVVRVREAIELCLEADGSAGTGSEFVGVQRITV